MEHNNNNPNKYLVASEILFVMLLIVGAIAVVAIFKWQGAVKALKNERTNIKPYYDEKAFLSAIDSLDEVSIRLHSSRLRADKVQQQLDSIVGFRAH